MFTYFALLRAVNVGGTGKLPMADLRLMCETLGFANVRTYIASGNVVFASPQTVAEVKSSLEDELRTYANKPVGVVVFTPVEMKAVLDENPFPERAGNRTVAIFLDDDPPPDTMLQISGQKREEIALGRRVVYVHYGDAMAESKLKIPAAASGTARNMNTVAALVAMSIGL